MVTIREDGCERRVTADEGFLLQLTQRGLAGDSTAARASLEAIEAARAARGDNNVTGITKIVIRSDGNGADSVLEKLGMTKLKYPTDEVRARFELNPWIVEEALARLGCRRLSKEEQREVWNVTRTSHKVNWPEWWTERAS